ncbi:phosphoenolpyruvate synthase [Candidatus Uhrbacteria bacterium]|nr:phosphoenolpyruvate synthase [Candidatus Uhrbacteria bacterium]
MSRTESHILWFSEINKDDVPLVGGKNANLGELYQKLTTAESSAFPDEHVQVPYGFAVTAYAYRTFISHNTLDQSIHDALQGLDTRDIAALETCGQTIRQMILEGQFPPELESDIRSAHCKLAEQCKTDTKSLDLAVRSSATAEDLPDASFAGQQETYLNVRGELEVLEHIKKAFASLFTNRAISYRQDQQYSHFDVALSVAVQKMVRSDIAASGVAFSLDTESGFRDIVLINGSWGLGELVVKGAVIPDEYKVFKPTLRKGFRSIVSKRAGPKKHKLIYSQDAGNLTKEVLVADELQHAFVLSDDQVLQLARWVVLIEDHYGRPMDIEWAVDGQLGSLFIVQARPETVQSQKQQGHVLEEYRLKQRGPILVQGAAVGAKIGKGSARCISDVAQMAEFKAGEVLVTEITDPDWEPIMKLASAIVTNSGGRTSHAAIISRELGIPAVVGCGNATAVITTGMELTVSCAEGEVGRVYQGLLEFGIERNDLTGFQPPSVDIKLIAADPELAFHHAKLPHRGVGLAREEFIISNYIKIHPNVLIQFDELADGGVKAQVETLTKGYRDKLEYYVDTLSYGIAQLGAAFYPYDVLLRFSDFKSNEYANLMGGTLFEPKEENPMLGWRGASRYYDPQFEKAFSLECQAVKRVREQMGLWNVSVMVPFCRTPEEGKKVVELITKYGLNNRITPEVRKKKKNGDIVEGLEIWVMAEIPSNILQVEEFADIFDGFSIGSNDLTQLTLGLDRDSKMIAHVGNERSPAIRKLIKTLIAAAHARGLKVGICGQAPSDFPDFAEFLVREGIDSISISADTVLKAAVQIRQLEDRLSATAAPTTVPTAPKIAPTSHS